MTTPSGTRHRPRARAGTAVLLAAGFFAASSSTAASTAGASVAASGAGGARLSATAVAALAGVAPAAPVRLVVTEVAGGRPSWRTVTVGSREQASSVVRAAAARPEVLGVTVDTRVRALGAVAADQPGVGPAGGGSGARAVDPLRPQQWALDRLRGDRVAAAVTGADQVVAVVDSGVHAGHEDFAAGTVLAGVDYVDGGDARVDPHGHGTHVAGIVAAARGNGVGVAGLTAAKVLPMRVLDATGAGWGSDAAQAIVDAVDRGASVVNLSLGGTHEPAYDPALAYAASRGVVVVAAAGNHRGVGEPEWPAAGPGVLAVAASTRADVTAAFSSTGRHVDVAAPGESVLSLRSPSGYVTMSGTSMASPYAAALAALVRSAVPGLTAPQVVERITRTADDIEAPGRDDAAGAGVIDPRAALGLPAAPPLAPRAVTAVPGERRATVSFAPPVDDGGAAVTSYVVTAQPGGISATGAGSPVVVAGLQNGSRYTVTVRAVNAAGTGPASAEITVVPTTDPGLARWLELGGAAGPLGAPVEGPYPVPGGQGRTFAAGRIYWATGTADTRVVVGDILNAYLRVGGPWGPLGLPTTDELAVTGGRASLFTGGRVYWSPTTAARAVYGDILNAYLRVGGPDGPLGLPTTDELGVTGGRASLFTGGRVYWSPTTAARAVYGDILNAYLRVGGPDGPLGLPTTDELGVTGGRASYFTGGRIYWSPTTAARAVYGSILGAYLGTGGPDGRLGLPRSDEYPVPVGRRSDFQRGAIVWDARTGRTTVL